LLAEAERELGRRRTEALQQGGRQVDLGAAMQMATNLQRDDEQSRRSERLNSVRTSVAASSWQSALTPDRRRHARRERLAERRTWALAGGRMIRSALP
jgi:hypothetical protein